MSTKLKVRPKVDIAFKKIFTENEDLLKNLLIEALALQSAKSILLKPSEVTPQNPDEKFCRFDIRVEVDKIDIDVEIQLAKRSDFPARAEYYSSLLFTHLKRGDNYNDLPRTIVVCFVEHPLFDWPEYHSEFVTMERKYHEPLTDKKEIHFFELKKIPLLKDAKTKLEYWLNVIAAETEEDIAEISKTVQDADIQTALNEVRRLNKDPKFIDEVAAREVNIREEASALSAADQAGAKRKETEVVKAFLADGMSLEKIASVLKISDERMTEIKKSLEQ